MVRIHVFEKELSEQRRNWQPHLTKKSRTMGKWTRRAFITTGVLTEGAFVLGVAIRPGNRANKVKHLIGGEEESVINIWLKISKDNIVTVIVPHVEMGQGTHTTLPMMLADEMDADWSKVRMMEANISRFRAALDDTGQITAWNNQFLFKHDPEEAPHIPYRVANKFIRYTESDTHIPWGIGVVLTLRCTHFLQSLLLTNWLSK